MQNGIFNEHSKNLPTTGCTASCTIKFNEQKNRRENPSLMPIRKTQPSVFRGQGFGPHSLQTRRRLGRIVAVLTFVCALAQSAAQSAAQMRFVDVTSSTGIDFRHTDGGTGQHYIVEYVSAGLATFDFDNDGDIDIYFLSGQALNRHNRPSDKRKADCNRLYRNDGNWQFTDVTHESGVGDTRHSLGVAIGDYNNDGAADIYVSNFGPNRLYPKQFRRNLYGRCRHGLESPMGTASGQVYRFWMPIATVILTSTLQTT